MSRSINSSSWEPFEWALRHPIACGKPAPDFFEGALLGNDALGVVVTTRPDAVVIHFGHNDVWDIRVSETSKEKVGTFKDVFDKASSIPAEYSSLDQDPWYREYYAMARADYDKSYPRPIPCGSLVLGFDPRKAELLGHRVRIDVGLCEVFFLVRGAVAKLQVFVESDRDRVWVRLIDDRDQNTSLPFERVRLIPDASIPDEFPTFGVSVSQAQHALAFRQLLPSGQPTDARELASAKDRAFRLTVRLSDAITLREARGIAGSPPAPYGKPASTEGQGNSVPIEAVIHPTQDFVACVQLDQGGADTVLPDLAELPLPSNATFESAASGSRYKWREFWNRSGVALEDEFLERIWYWNLYFFNCAVRPGTTCPGLFANWSFGRIGSAWHGDYHMNYNTQQSFWVTFSSNHVDKHLAYVDLVDHLLPVSRNWAKSSFQNPVLSR